MNNEIFKNYEEFKELFVREDGTRKNGILLSFLKDKNVRDYLKEHNLYWVFNEVSSMTALYSFCKALISRTSHGDYYLSILGKDYNHPLFRNSDSMGVCYDDDNKFRYLSHRDPERPRVMRQKIGALYRDIIDRSEFGALLPEKVKIYLCETITQDWVTKNKTARERYTLVVDDNFEEIYSPINMYGDFHSCMTGKGQHYFYRDAVKARAARLLDSELDGRMVARCVIFDEVVDYESGEVFRLAERQYSSNCDDKLKQILVNRLIQGGHIDGYKKVGADCHNSRAFISKDGDDWSSRKFYIKCNLHDGDILSYQDSFKYFVEAEQRAYNTTWDIDGYRELDTTDRTFESEEEHQNYDEYHGEYTSDEVVSVCYRGRWMTCSESDLDDFIYIENEGYYFYDDVYVCPCCGEYFISGWDSDISGRTYCSESCREKGDDEYKEENWFYSEWDEEYFEYANDITTMVFWYGKRTISLWSACRLMSRGEVIEDDHGTLIHYSFLQHKLDEN